jgi:ubiquinone/menaquinone biosynthesis C-methylase UbiE
MRILEIGPGTPSGRSALFASADTLDLLGEPTYRASWGGDPLPVPSDTYDLVFASHVLEHIPWYRAVAGLREVHRILKPGGEFEVYVPDFAYIVQCYREKKCGDNWRVFNQVGHWMTWVNGRLFTYGEDAIELLSKQRPIPQTHHKAAYDTPYLLQRLHEAGFKEARALSKRRHGHAHAVREAGALAVR